MKLRTAVFSVARFDFVVSTFAFSKLPISFGTASAAIMPMITTTIMISISVKFCLRLRCMVFIFLGSLWFNGLNNVLLFWASGQPAAPCMSMIAMNMIVTTEPTPRPSSTMINGSNSDSSRLISARMSAS